MGGPDKLARQKAQGKLNVRERILQLADGGSFRELGSLAGKASYNEAGELESFALIALRHAKAAFDSPSGRDTDRRLTPRGQAQARAVVPALAAWGPTRIVSCA